MKVKSSLVLRQVMNVWLVIPLITESRSECLMKLNETGAMLWKLLEQGADASSLADALIREYGISCDQALQDAQQFIDKLLSAGCLDSDA